MLIKDNLYGEFQIEDVIREIIETKEIQRLKGVYQGGASILVNKNWNVTRYEHSVGTMLLVKLLGGCIKEQIAALIHDISHTAFSHVVDYALDNKNDDYHEMIFEELVINSLIPEILEKYGYNLEEIIDDSNYSILEKKAPKLCADRIDYTLRDMYNAGTITKEEINHFLKDLCVINGEVVVNSVKSCEWFVNTYYKEVVEYFMHPLNIYAYDKLSSAIRICIENNLIDKKDLLEDDKTLLRKMKMLKDMNVTTLLNDLHYNVEVVENKNDYDIHKTTKLRLVDPTAFINNKTLQSSNLSKFILDTNKSMKSKIDEGIYIKVL